jgi:hypothetical protein
MAIFDFTDYIPESLKKKYQDTGYAQTIIDKALQLFSQVLSGEAGSYADLESKLLELENFWDAYKVEDLTKLKSLLDVNNLTLKVAEINNICGLEVTDDSEKAYLANVQALGKLKGTLKGITNILRLFGISLEVIPWYASNYPNQDDPECSIIISTYLDNGCLSDNTPELIEEIIKSLLDVCVIVAGFEIIKSFTTQIPFGDALSIYTNSKDLCLYWDWRYSRTCCENFCIANAGLSAYYSNPDPGECYNSGFDHMGSFIHKCKEALWCDLTRVDLAIVDPVVRAYSELEVDRIEYQENNRVRYYLKLSKNLQNINVGDAVYVTNSHYSINNEEFNVTSTDNNDGMWIEVSNPFRNNSNYDEADSIGCEAILAVVLYYGHNRDILDYGFPVRRLNYDNPWLIGIDLGDSIGDGTGQITNGFVGTNWPKAGDFRECPDIFEAYYSILNDDRQWGIYEEDSIGDEYYLILDDSLGFDLISEPTVILESEAQLTRSTHTQLGLGEWDFAYNETLGYSTIFIKLLDGTNPNLQADNYLEAGVVKDYCVKINETTGPDHHFWVPIAE